MSDKVPSGSPRSTNSVPRYRQQHFSQHMPASVIRSHQPRVDPQTQVRTMIAPKGTPPSSGMALSVKSASDVSTPLSPISPASSGGTVVGSEPSPTCPTAPHPKQKRGRANKSKKKQGGYARPNANADRLYDRALNSAGGGGTLEDQGIVNKIIKAVKDAIGLKDEVQGHIGGAADDAEPVLEVAAAVTGIPEIADSFTAVAQVITGFLDAIASTVPGSQPFVACAKLLLKYGEAYCKCDNAAGELCSRVIFVLQSTAALYQNDWKVDSRAVEWVLTNLNSVIEQCCVFFKAHDTRGKVAQFFYAKQTLEKIEAADKRLAHAMEDLTFILQIDSRQQCIKSAEWLANRFKQRSQAKPWALSEAEVNVQRAIETKGGADVVQQQPQVLDEIAKGIPGVECVTERDLQQLKVSFDDCCADVKRAMATVLDKLDKQSLSINQIDSQIKELAERGSVFKQITCHAVRAVWIKSGWGARVKVEEFLEVIMEEMQLEVDAEQVRLKCLGRTDVKAELVRRFQYFDKVLRCMDADGSGAYSPSEVNSFFNVPEWPLLDYFRLVAIYIPKYEYEKFKSVEAAITMLCEGIDRNVLLTLPCRAFLRAAKKLLFEVQSQAGSDRMAMKWTNFRTTMPPFLGEEFDTRLPQWETQTLPQHTVPAMRFLHIRLYKSCISIVMALEAQDEECMDATIRWQRYLRPAFWKLLVAINGWARGPATSLLDLMSSANVWYTSEGPLLAQLPLPDEARPVSQNDLTCLPSSAIHPVLGTAWFPHDLLPFSQPTNAVEGGMLRGKPVYLTRCDIVIKDGEWALACGYAYCEPDTCFPRFSSSSKMVLAATPNGRFGPDTAFSWLVHQRNHLSTTNAEDGPVDSSAASTASCYRWVRFNLTHEVPVPYAAILGRGDMTRTIWIARASIAPTISKPTKDDWQSKNPTPPFTLERNKDTSDVLGSLPRGEPLPTSTLERDVTSPNLHNPIAQDVLPGSVFMHWSGELEFITCRPEEDGKITVISTLDEESINEFFIKPETLVSRYVSVARSELQVELLVPDKGEGWNQLYSCFDWQSIYSAGQFSGFGMWTPSIMCGTSNIPGHLAWCMYDGKMFVGMCFPSVSRTLAFFTPDSGLSDVFTTTTRFIVFMNNSETDSTSLNRPASNLIWFPSPDLSGKQLHDGVLQLVTVSTGQYQEPTPIIRQQRDYLIPTLAALGIGAFTIHSEPTTTALNAARPPLRASLLSNAHYAPQSLPRTEYLYIVLASTHRPRAARPNWHMISTRPPAMQSASVCDDALPESTQVPEVAVVDLTDPEGLE